MVVVPRDVGGVGLAIVGDAPTRRRLARLFRHFPSAPGGAQAFAVVESRDQCVRLSVRDAAGAVLLAESYDGADLETWFKHRVLCAVFRARRAAVLGLHGCAFTVDGGARVVLGPSGTGKSTVTRLACDAGASYVCDDAILLDPVTLRVIPYPILMSVKAEGHLPSFSLPRGTRIERRSRPVASLILPEYAPGTPETVERLDVGAALTAILRNFRNTPAFGPEAIELAARLARAATAFRIVSGSRAAALALLRRLFPTLRRGGAGPDDAPPTHRRRTRDAARKR